MAYPFDVSATSFRSGNRRSLVAGVFLLLLMLSPAITLLNTTVEGVPEPAREVVSYNAAIDTDVPEEHICLAGHRWFQLDLVFHDLYGRNISMVGIDLRADADTTRVLTFDVLSEELEQTSLWGQLDIKNGVVGVQDMRNITFSVQLFFHLNWTFDRSFALTSSLILNGTAPSMDTAEVLEIKVHGGMEPFPVTVQGPSGEEITESRPMRPNSSIYFNDIRFKYYHPVYDVSSYSPLPEEVLPVIILEDREWAAEWNGSSYSAQARLPLQKEGKVSFEMYISNITEEWQTKVDLWKFVVDLDGLPPQIKLKSPLVKVLDPQFQWSVEIIDRPAPGDYFVDGSSLEYRVYKGGMWGPWSDVSPLDDAQSLTFIGTAEGERGNSTRLQFRVSDVLGNTGTSDPMSEDFVIEINIAPTLDIPGDLDGKEYWDDQTISINGYDLVSDPDDDNLDFEWFMDDEERPISTSNNLTKNLFNEQPGEHTLTVRVQDPSGGEDEATFGFVLNMVPEQEDETSIMDVLTDSLFLTIAIPILVLIVFGILVIIIIVVSKRFKKGDDFVINEGSAINSSQAEEMANRIREIYEEKEVYSATFSEDDAHISNDEGKFDFDYDLYEVLGVEKGADVKDIKRAYRKLAAFYHPDRIATQPDIDPEEAAEEMIRVNKAKEFLLNPELRADYDEYISDMDFSFEIGEDEEDEDWD
ncbi:MAG: J domain-containing protein [Thermoplasmatota archaeon]